MRLLAKSAALLALSAFVWSAAARGEPFDLHGADWQACDGFVQIAEAEVGASRVSVVTTLDMRHLQREDAIILLHPTRALDADALSAFMRHGGRVILLDDYGTGDTLLRHFGIERVPAPAHPSEELRNNPSFAIAEPASNHPVVKDVTKVVTNHPTGLRHPELSPVLKIRSKDGNDVLLAQAGAVGQGRFLAVGDASVVIDEMLRYPGNRAFARALIRYATDDDSWGKRGGHVYIAANAFDMRGRFGEASTFWDDVDDARREAVEALEQVRRAGMPPAAAYVLAVGVGLAIVIWVGSRAGKPHRPVLPRFSRAVPVAVQGGVAGHAAVIGAPSTSRLLAMLELKSALEEGMCALLGLDAPPGTEALVAKVAGAGLLPDHDVTAMKQLLLRLANVETAALSRQAALVGKIRDREVLAVGRQVSAMLAAAGAAAKAQRA